MAKILVIGDSCIDVHIYGKVERLCPDAPVPVVVPIKTRENGGMAANVRDNLLSLGNQVDLITNSRPVYKTRYIDEKTNQVMLRVDTGDEHLPQCENALLQEINYNDYDAVVISDYNKGFLSTEQIVYISTQHSLTFVDTKKIISPEELYSVKFFKINQHEYINNTEAWKTVIKTNPDVLEKLKNKLIITYGSDGCTYRDKQYKVDKVSIKDNSGAGDTFLSGLVTEYLNSGDIDKAIQFANKCATIVVQQRGVVKVGDFL